MVDEQQGSDPRLCPNCMIANSEQQNFCTKCGLPMGDLVTIDPINRLWAQGWMYRQVLTGKPKLIVLFGIWVLCGGAILGVVMIGFTPDVGWLLSCLIAPIVLINAIIIYRVTRNYFSKSIIPSSSNLK
ncbi:MAG: hypothetical protein ACI9E5_000986 [Candidatus Omnitrophota bacterium]|jgi:hypothetical protein